MPLNPEIGAALAAAFGAGYIASSWYQRVKGWRHERRRRDREPEDATASATCAGLDPAIPGMACDIRPASFARILETPTTVREKWPDIPLC